MECTQDLHYQQQLEQQQQEEKPTQRDFDSIAYRCLGIAQTIKDCRAFGNVNALLSCEKSLIELATEYDNLKKKSWGMQ
jgi:hypothetical protein